jgi:hypothetical protein
LPQDSGGAGRVFNVFAISNVRFTSIRDIALTSQLRK